MNDKPFFGHGGHELPVHQRTRGGVGMESVKAENEHESRERGEWSGEPTARSAELGFEVLAKCVYHSTLLRKFGNCRGGFFCRQIALASEKN